MLLLVDWIEPPFWLVPSGPKVIVCAIKNTLKKLLFVISLTLSFMAVTLILFILWFMHASIF